MKISFEFVEEKQDENGKVQGTLVKRGTLKNEKKLKMAGLVLTEERTDKGHAAKCKADKPKADKTKGYGTRVRKDL